MIGDTGLGTAVGRDRLRVLMTTEGTYPFVVGGVSTWCQQLLTGLGDIAWSVLPLVAGGFRRSAVFDVPANVSILPEFELWSPPRRPRRRRGAAPIGRPDLALALVRELLGWMPDHTALVEALVWCRSHPDSIDASFRDRDAFPAFVAEVDRLAAESHPEVLPVEVNGSQAARLYQTVAWLARTAAVSTPVSDVVHVTAAGWAAIPALVDKATRGTPMLLTEHGVYVREAYLSGVRTDQPAGDRFIATRLARGLALAAYAAADLVCPVTPAHQAWEESLGVEPGRIRAIRNGVADPPSETPPLPGTSTVVSVGRLDPLKDVQTMLRVAAEVIRQWPEARFLHYGPVSDGQDAYAGACHELHASLGLAGSFRFCGSTTDPVGVLRDADVVVMTSISEGFPMSVLEAMSQARPVVSTAVGGVPEALHGCGVLAPPGDVHQIAQGVLTLLRDPAFAAELGRRGQARVRRRYRLDACLVAYREAIDQLASGIDERRYRPLEVACG